MPERSEPGDAVRRRDEILQVLFWMRGEGLGDTVSVQDIARFLAGAAALERDLDLLSRSGLVEAVGDGRFRLSQRGVEEGGRRFAEEFEDYVYAGHGACSDPSCDCHTLGPDACAHA